MAKEVCRVPHSDISPSIDSGVGIDILHYAVAPEAIHDSAESFPQPKCHPETRTKMLNELREWALRWDASPEILWLYGPAGAGKSAIMQTLASQLQDAGRLGGSFFFKRGHVTRGNGRTLFATIAYQLALSVPRLRDPISQVVERNPSVVGRSIWSQIQELICEPCRLHGACEPVTILIDGLDECSGHGFQQEILRSISKSFSNGSLPLRFIVASRPEPHLREIFDSPVYLNNSRPFNVEQSFDDVRKYLCDEFARIHREHRTMAGVPSPWPSPDVLEQLVRDSSGHFIYASTIIKFVDDKSYRPTRRLAVVQDANSMGSESVFDALDQLYINILNASRRQSELIPILGVIVNFEVDADTIDQFFGLVEGETRLLLHEFHSLLHIPDDDEDSPWNQNISSHHASFLDFLNSPNRSRDFCVGTLHCRIDLARSLLQFCAGNFEKLTASGSGYVQFVLETQYIISPILRLLGRRLIPFIVSLPPSAELRPLLGLMNPDYIFRLEYEPNLRPMISWLKVSFGPFAGYLWI
jgi:hypothetical protein